MTDFADMIEGYRRFREGDWRRQRERWEKLAEGQNPQVMVVACSDSRIDPSVVFDSRPGEMFVVRNVANLVPPFELGGLRHGVSAALEFAVTQLNVSEIIVLGHGQCGGVSASLSRRIDDKPPGAGGTAVRALELECVKVSLANLRTFPCIPPREADGSLRLIGAYFAISDGVLHLLDEASGAFAPV